MNKPTFTPKGLDLIKQTIVILTILVLTFVVGMSYSLTQYNILVFFAILITMLGGSWLIFGQKTSTPLKPTILVWLVAYTISVILSIDPRRSLSQMFLMLVGIFLFLLAYDLISRGWQITWFMKGFILVGVIVIILSLNEAGSWYLRWLRVNPGNWFPDISYRLGTANLMPPFLFLSFHMGLPLLLKSEKRITKIFLGVIMFLGMVVLYLTSSRGGWLGMFFGLVVWGVYFLTTARDFIKTSIQKLFAKKILFFAILLVFVVIISLGGYLLYKQAVHPTHGSILGSRAGLWGPAITAFKENPVFGQGPFTYGSSFLRENSTPPNSVYPHAHSIYLNLLGEMGIVGFLAAALFMVVYFIKFRGIFQQSKDKLFLLSIFAFIVSCAVHNIFDAYHTKPAMLWPLAILAGAAIAQPSIKTFHQTKPRSWGVLLLIPFAWLGIWAIAPYYQAVELANQSQWHLAYEKFQQAVNRDPQNALAHQQLALSAAVLAQQGEQGMLDIAIHSLETTIQFEPSWALNHANLSSIFFTQHDIQKGLACGVNAILLAPNSALFKINYNPTWGELDFAEMYSVSTNMRQRLSDEYLLDNEETALRLAEFHQYSWAHNIEAKVYLENNDLISTKRSLLNAELSYQANNSDSIETKWLWAKYYAKIGDYEEAIQRGKAAYDLYTNYGIFGPGTFGVLQYAPNIFRMKAMAMEIIPQMIDIPIPEEWVQRSKLVESWKSEIFRR